MMKKGFTLMELLVVILIIGILVGIAVPQYLKVVNRGRAVEALSVLKTVTESIQRASKLHANVNWDTLDIKYDGTPQGDGSVQTKFFKYYIVQISDGNNHYYVLAKSLLGTYVFEKHIVSGDIFPAICVYGDDAGQEVCNSMKFNNPIPAGAPANATPGTGVVQ